MYTLLGVAVIAAFSTVTAQPIGSSDLSFKRNDDFSVTMRFTGCQLNSVIVPNVFGIFYEDSLLSFMGETRTSDSDSAVAGATLHSVNVTLYTYACPTCATRTAYAKTNLTLISEIVEESYCSGVTIDSINPPPLPPPPIPPPARSPPPAPPLPLPPPPAVPPSVALAVPPPVPPITSLTLCGTVVANASIGNTCSRCSDRCPTDMYSNTTIRPLFRCVSASSGWCKVSPTAGFWGVISVAIIAFVACLAACVYFYVRSMRAAQQDAGMVSGEDKRARTRFSRIVL